MGYSCDVRLKRGDDVVDSWDVSGSYGCIDGMTHPYNVFMHSFDNFRDIREEVQHRLDNVREVKDSGRWEESETILLEIQSHVEKESDPRRLSVWFVNTDYEDHEY